MLVKDGRVVRGFLGVNIRTVTADLAKEHNLGANRGAVVADVQPNGPAAKAGPGLRRRDRLAERQRDPQSDVLRNTIALLRPGTTVDPEVVARRGEQEGHQGQAGRAAGRQRAAPARRPLIRIARIASWTVRGRSTRAGRVRGGVRSWRVRRRSGRARGVLTRSRRC